MLNEGAKDLTVIALDQSQFPISVFTLTFDEKRKLQNFQAAIGDARKELENLKSGNCQNSEFIAKLNSKVELLELESATSQNPSKRASSHISSRSHEHPPFRQSSFEQLISNFGNVEVDDGGIWAG
ncbi:unnamed protein product [Oikopleura dioica]|uniref:Uncharacterized protein n=1 Tax=Oikopleura dioica TaxID=34765 RepID=E4XKJ5_OIKDI|nr:unnamed protein product [Oikopleura dioica]